MPTIRNGNLNKDIDLNIHLVRPRETKTTAFYSWDPKAEILDHEAELWMFDLTGEPWSEAITTSKIVPIPEETNLIEVWNGSASTIRIYNYKQNLVTPAPTIADPNAKKKNFGILIPPSGIRYIPRLDKRVYQIEIVGTVALGELVLTFTSKVD